MLLTPILLGLLVVPSPAGVFLILIDVAAFIQINIRRTSDNFFYDWSDATFKAAGAVVTMYSAALTPVDATNMPGVQDKP